MSTYFNNFAQYASNFFFKKDMKGRFILYLHLLYSIIYLYSIIILYSIILTYRWKKDTSEKKNIAIGRTYEN